jgi:hypothetical protein
MRDSTWSPMSTILEAATTVTGWALVIAMTVVLGFCCGYWIGQGGVVGPSATFRAFVSVSFIWLGQPLLFIPYAVTALAFYLPVRFESRGLYIANAILTLFAWLIVTAITNFGW